MEEREINELSDLESNKRDHKVEITDIAISKVPLVRYKGIPEDHYVALQHAAMEALRVAKEENDNNEVAVLYDLDCPEKVVKGDRFIAISKGTEHSVDPLDDTDANHVYSSASGCVVIITHNHPSLSKVSLRDVIFLMDYAKTKMIVAVTNRGSISYVSKSDKYDYVAANRLMKDAVKKYNEAKNLKEKQEASDYFLNNCYKVGLLYDDH